MSASGSNPSSPQNKKGCVDGGPIGKKPRIEKMVGASAGVRTRQAFAVVNGSAPGLPQTASVAGSYCGATIEFSKEAVEALLNEKMEKGYGLKDMDQWEQGFNYIRRLQLCIKWFLELEGNYMVEQEKLQTMSQTASVAGSDCGAIEYSKEAVEALLMVKMNKGSSSDLMEQWQERTNYIRKLRLCIKWFLELEGNYMEEQEKLQAMLNAVERRCDEAELVMKNEEELNASAQEKVAKEESDKLAVTNRLAREKEARLSAEKLQTSLSEEVAKCQRELQASNQKLEMYKRLQEYTTSLQQYNTKMESELAAANDNLKRVEKEKAAVVENLSTARGHNKSLQDISGGFKLKQSSRKKR